ncbi:carbohydrate kinase family protein, partial [Candidatus Saccharibacteria bacterium]|nr:carbohydrate kinase family protein [Candidatus Saccharibacteria bacterium]
MARIVSLGSALQDIYLIDHDDLVPTSIGESAIFGKVLVGSKVDIDKICYEVGGGGMNSVITFSRHGHEAILLGNISRDPAGMAILKKLDEECVDNSYIHFLERRNTGASVILLDRKSGERTILTCRGASEQFGNLDENDLDLVQPDWLYVTTLRGDIDTLERFFKKAKAIDTKIMFNPGVKELENQKALTRLLKYVDVLNVNKSEAAKLVPGVVLTELLYHLSGYVGTVIITDGPMGGIAGNGEETYRFGIYEDTKIKDTTGAGDAF